jgi:hypothetical protein
MTDDEVLEKQKCDCDVCRSSEKFLKSVSRMVSERGYAIVASQDHDSQTPYTFTIGLAVKGFPDLVAFGLVPEQATPFIMDLAEGMLKDKVVPNEGAMVNEYMTTFEVPDMARAHSYMPQAEKFYEYRGIACVGEQKIRQIVWADADHKMPWQRGCDPETVNSQSFLIDWGGGRAN